MCKKSDPNDPNIKYTDDSFSAVLSAMKLSSMNTITGYRTVGTLDMSPE